VFPEVNRDYHAGKKGTFMDDYHHNRYFKDIDYNTDGGLAYWRRPGQEESPRIAPPWLWGSAAVYEARLVAALTSPRTLHLANLRDLEEQAQGTSRQGMTVVLWHETDFGSRAEVPPFKAMADYFNIWHEWYRTAHAGCLHTFRWG